jgi:hypothetical protein
VPAFPFQPSWYRRPSAATHPFDIDANAGQRLESGIVPGRIRLWRSGHGMTEDPWRLYAMLGAERPKVIRGTGGWGPLDRDGRRAVSTFTGSGTPAYSIGLRLANDRPISRPVAEQMRTLERLCGWDRADDDPPPVLQFLANVAHDFADAPQNEWVAEDSIEWGDSNSTDRGTLLWIDATIVLGLYVETAVAGLDKPAGFARHVLKAGWDLRDFAKHFLGDATRWRDVADLNRDDPKCPTSPSFKPKRPVTLLTPPREPKSKAKRAKRGKDAKSKAKR